MQVNQPVHEDVEVLRAVPVGIGEQKRAAGGLNVAQLACGAAEGRGPDEGKGIVDPGRGLVGIDARQVDHVQTILEVADDVAPAATALRLCYVGKDEHIGCPVARESTTGEIPADQDVAANPAMKRIGAVAATQLVIVVATGQVIVLGAPKQRIAARAADDGVSARPANEVVVAVLAIDEVIPTEPKQGVGGQTAYKISLWCSRDAYPEDDEDHTLIQRELIIITQKNPSKSLDSVEGLSHRWIGEGSSAMPQGDDCIVNTSVRFNSVDGQTLQAFYTISAVYEERDASTPVPEEATEPERFKCAQFAKSRVETISLSPLN